MSGLIQGSAGCAVLQNQQVSPTGKDMTVASREGLAWQARVGPVKYQLWSVPGSHCGEFTRAAVARRCGLR